MIAVGSRGVLNDLAVFELRPSASHRTCVPPGAHADCALEHTREVRLVGESAGRGDGGRRIAGGEQPTRVIDAQVALERMRGDAVLLAEAAHQLEPAEPGRGGELGERDPLVPSLGQVAPRPADRRMLGPIASARRWSRLQMGTEGADRAQYGLVDGQIARRVGRKGFVSAHERAAQRPVAEHHPASGARSRPVALRPVVEQPRLDVQHLVRPPLRNRRHPGVDGLRLEHEQLSFAGALLGRVERKPCRSALDDGDRPGRVRMGPVGVTDESRVQRLDAVEPRGMEIGGVLSWRDPKVRMRAHPRGGDHAHTLSDPDPDSTRRRVAIIGSLIEHPKIGPVLFDTGAPPNWKELWPPIIRELLAITSYEPEQHLDAALGAAGFGIEDIKAIVLSHLHVNHAGGLEFFRGTDVLIYVQGDELERAKFYD
jgi:Metallo-beta-lactamase superfamily